MFSIIVPVYNVEKYIEEAVFSVIKQNFNDYEVILIDDGSTDKSGQICDELAKQYPQITVIHQQNQGQSVARNVGIHEAKGEYIVFLDSDDRFAVNGLYNLNNVIEDNNHPEIIISRRATIINNKIVECKYYFPINELKNKTNVEVYEKIRKYPDMWFGPWIFTVSRKYIETNLLYFYPGILHEDEEWIPRVFFNNGKIGYNNNILYVNRPNRAGGTTSTPNIKKLFDRIFIIDELEDKFAKSKYSVEIRKCITQKRAMLLFGIINELKQYRKEEKYSDLILEIRKRLVILNFSNRFIHRITYILCKYIGIYQTSKILNLVK